MVAAAAGSLEVAKMLVAAGADVNAKTDFGWTALMEAYFEGYPEVAAFLNQVGANLTGFLEGQYLARSSADELRWLAGTVD
jgi:ankyrin repeat protein